MRRFTFLQERSNSLKRIGASLKILILTKASTTLDYGGEDMIIPLCLLLMFPCAVLEESLHANRVYVKYERCSSDLQVKRNDHSPSTFDL